MDYIEKWPYMVIFQYNLYIFGIHVWIMLYPKPCYNKPCYKEVEVYNLFTKVFTAYVMFILKNPKMLTVLEQNPTF